MIISFAIIYKRFVSSGDRSGLPTSVRNAASDSALGGVSVHSIARSALSASELSRFEPQHPMKTCLSSALGRCNACAYCDWVERGANLDEVAVGVKIRPEAARQIRIYVSDKKAGPIAVDGPILRPAGAFRKRRKLSSIAEPEALPETPAEAKLYRFLRLIRHMESAPWANVSFQVNSDIISRLIASHLHLIIGKSQFKQCNRKNLYRNISATVVLDDAAQNLVWITNRQVRLQIRPGHSHIFVANMACLCG